MPSRGIGCPWVETLHALGFFLSCDAHSEPPQVRCMNTRDQTVTTMSGFSLKMFSLAQSTTLGKWEDSFRLPKHNDLWTFWLWHRDQFKRKEEDHSASGARGWYWVLKIGTYKNVFHTLDQQLNTFPIRLFALVVLFSPGMFIGENVVYSMLRQMQYVGVSVIDLL